MEQSQSSALATDTDNLSVHISVLPTAILSWLQPYDGGRYIDATLGGGGHTQALLQGSAARGSVLAIDADGAARQRVHQLLFAEVQQGRLQIVAGNFRHMAEYAADFAPVDGIVMDLGLSSDQLADRDRGFSFAVDAPLDMRFDTSQGQSAAEFLATASEFDIADVIYRFGEERRSRAIARQIVARREHEPLTRTKELADLVARVIPGRPSGIHPATRTFQALRIAVNGELDALTEALPQARDLLKPGGRLAVISFHSLEDRIVKHWLRAEEKGCICPPQAPVCVCGQAPRMKILTNHPQMADEAEIASNVRAHSAKLRVAERL